MCVCVGGWGGVGACRWGAAYGPRPVLLSCALPPSLTGHPLPPPPFPHPSPLTPRHSPRTQVCPHPLPPDPGLHRGQRVQQLQPARVRAALQEARLPPARAGQGVDAGRAGGGRQRRRRQGGRGGAAVKDGPKEGGGGARALWLAGLRGCAWRDVRCLGVWHWVAALWVAARRRSRSPIGLSCKVGGGSMR